MVGQIYAGSPFGDKVVVKLQCRTCEHFSKLFSYVCCRTDGVALSEPYSFEYLLFDHNAHLRESDIPFCRTRAELLLGAYEPLLIFDTQECPAFLLAL